uniref:Pentatricopeptide repeat-containing protein n=1 Tax=Chenopodium quinoa TaxID=63459 RepID=A0A803N6N5_CHEQI
MPKRNLISWSTMVKIYVQHGFAEEGLMVFSECRWSCDENPNEYVLASVVRACVQMGVLAQGTQVHGDIDDARLVFDELNEKSLFTWTIMMTGYAKSGRSDVSVMLFHQLMRDHDVVPDRYVLSSVLNACSVLEYFEGGKQIHAHVLRRRMELDVSVMNVLLDSYVKCGRVLSGRKLFDKIDAKDAISWTTMIAGYMQNSFHVEALQLFHRMNRCGRKLDDFVCSSILNSCGSLEALLPGKQVHAYIIKANLEYDKYVRNGLIDMYSKCNSLADARMAFDSVIQNNVISYNAMIEGYSRLGMISEALILFHDMRIKLLHPSLLTYVSILGVAASLSFLELSKQIHGLIIKVGGSSNLFASSALIDVYCKCNFLEEARLVFNEISEKDVVVWNALLFGYTQQLENEEALNLYSQFQVAGQKANEFTFVAMLTAASNLASLRHGQQFHCQLMKSGLDSDAFVTNALLDMYAKCGCLQDAYKLFNTTTWKDIACWNSMISTYANHGVAEEALSLYEKMLQDGLQPNYVTFIGLLSACSHVGLVEAGLNHFDTMFSYGIEPGMEHYACMVSLFGRAGKLNDAKEFIEKMPVKPAAIVWRSLLSACRATGNYELGAYAAEMAISSNPEDSGSYILLSNIYASKGMWTEVKEIRERMESNLVIKEPGCSWIEIDDKVNTFVSRDISHCRTDEVFSVLHNLIKEMKGVGHVVDTAPTLIDYS